MNSVTCALPTCHMHFEQKGRKKYHSEACKAKAYRDRKRQKQRHTHVQSVTIGNATLYLGDCLEVIKLLPDNSVDAIITDPPYFTPAVHYQSKMAWARTWSDMSILQGWWQQIAKEFRRICHDTGHVLTFCNAESYPVFYQAMFPLWAKLACLVWNKKNAGFGRIWRHQHELIIAARNTGYYCTQDGKFRSDILTHTATPSNLREHPVEKPVALLTELVEACTPPHKTVADFFMGGGSTAVATLKSGRKFIGVEKDPQYFELVCRRIEKVQQEQ